MTTLRFISGPAEALGPTTQRVEVVLDESWTPDQDLTDAPLPIAPAMGRVIERFDGFARALDAIDDWADAAGLVDLLTIDGVAWWFRLREGMVNWLHERLLWRSVLDELVPGERAAGIRACNSEAALLDVADALGIFVTVEPGPASAAMRESGPFMARGSRPSLRARLGRLIRGAGIDRHEPLRGRATDGILDARIRRMAEDSPRPLVLSHTGIREWVDRPGGRRLVDPLVGPIIDRLRERDASPIVVGLGLDHRDAAHRSAIEGDDDLLPGSILLSRYRSSAEEDPTPRIDAAVASFTSIDASLVIDGADLTMAALAEIERSLRSVVASSLRQIPRITRLIEEIHATALLLTHEGIRTPWLVAARRRGVPTAALQHGMIYPAHPGYRIPRHPAWVRPDRTFVYGPWERRVLLEAGGYEADEVEVSGSPRDDPASAGATCEATHASERAAVRRELGVAHGDRLLLISTTFSRLGRRYLLHMLRRLLDDPLPGVHLLFKQHPGEPDRGPYEALIHGLAEAGGWTPPPMSVVRSEDLMRLLRACDAHLGLYSTVLTDAVLADTPNLTALVSPVHDLLGYVPAGVARPVGTPSEVLAALAEPTRADPAARRSFLADHFDGTDAPGVIAEWLLATGRQPTVGSVR